MKMLTLENAPLGTKAPAIMGGHWTRVEGGWKWCTGATFPRPGGDWNGKLIPPKASVKESLTTEQPEDGPVAVIRIIPGSSPRDDLESHPVIALHRPSARNRSVSLQQDDDTNVVQWHVQSPDGFWRPVGHRFSLPSEVAIRTRLWHENQRLRERVRELEADAARYRWLRGECENPNGGLTIASVTEWGLEGWSGDDPDNRIDAAMQEGES